MKLTDYSFRKGDTFLFCGYRDHDHKLYNQLTKKYNMLLLDRPEWLTLAIIDKIQPKMIFFPNWSWKVPKEIVDKYPCVCYHEGDLPVGRGGSPIQNHIIRGMYDIKSTCYIMNDRIDAGPILCKRDLDLRGTLNEIFERILKNNYDMTVQIIESNPVPVEQDESKAIYFERRKPENSEIGLEINSIQHTYDKIRMLADPYPNAYIKLNDKTIKFKDAKLEDGKISGRYEIK